MIKKAKIKTFFLAFLLMYFNFPFFFNFTRTIQMFAVYGLCIVYLLVNRKKLYFIFNLKRTGIYCLKYAIVLYSVVFIFALITPIVHSTFDLAYINRLFNIFLSILKYLCFVILLIKNFDAKKILIKFCELFSYSCALYVLSTIFMLLIPEFKEFWRNIIFESERNYELSHQLNYITRYGFAGFSGFEHTFICSMGVLLVLFLIINSDKKANKSKYYLLLFMCLLGTFFYGRVGMLSACLSIGLTLVYSIIKKRKIKLFLLIICFLLIGALIISVLLKNNELVEKWFLWAFAPFISFFETGHFSTGSSSYMFEKMYFMPEEKTFIFGDGRYVNSDGSYYKHTDIGFMRPLLYYGIFGELLTYFFVIVLIVGTAYSIRKIKFQGRNVFILLLFFQFVFFEMKGEMFFILINILIPLILLSVLQNISEKGGCS